MATVSVQHLMDEDQSTQGEYVLSGEEQYNVSAEGNVMTELTDEKPQVDLSAYSMVYDLTDGVSDGEMSVLWPKQ